MCTKTEILRSIASSLDWDIIILTETWLTPSISSTELNLHDNYIIYRLDRNKENSKKTKGGGILIAVHKRIPSRYLENNSPHLEHLFVKLYSNKLNIIICCSYRPPNSPPELLCQHLAEIDRLQTSSSSDLLIIGDYNLPTLSWDNNSNTAQSTTLEQIFHEAISDMNLRQFNHINNSLNHILDLVLSNIDNVSVIEADESILPLDKQYHPALDITVSIPSSSILHEQQSFYKNFKSCDYDNVNILLTKINWDELFLGLNLTESIDKFYFTLNNIIDQHVPIAYTKTTKFPHWYSTHLKQTILNKKAEHKKYKQSGSLAHYTNFKHLRTLSLKLTRKDWRNYITKTELSIPNNINNFWTYTNKFKKNTSIPPTMSLNDLTANTPKETCNLFAQYFSSVYSKLPCKTTTLQNTSTINISQLSITSTELMKKLDTLDPNKSGGPDGIPPIFLKNCAKNLLNPLLKLFNHSLNTGKFPSKWKTSFITPIYKDGDKSNITNYRPISTLSSIPKILDSLITNKLTPLFKNIIHTEQHGFTQGQSTLTNLITYENFLNTSLEQKLQVDSIYTDLSKAFDTVNHNLLLQKLHLLGVEGTLHLWLSGYLQNRKCTVKIRNNLSHEFVAHSGVPQGSHLGPLLFLIFFNDVLTVFNDVHVLLLADDLKMFKVIHSINDCQTLQLNLNIFNSWCTDNGLKLNETKCKFINFSRATNSSKFAYSIDNYKLLNVDNIRDLGVIFDSKLTFVPHINNIVSKARKTLGFITRITSSFRNIDALKFLFVALVRSKLEYCSVIWNPYYGVHKAWLERVQHKFLRTVNYKLGIHIDNLNYDYLISHLKLNTLEQRRDYYDLSFLFKLISGKIVCPIILSRLNFRIPLHSTRSQDMFVVPHHSTNFGKTNAIDRIQTLANKHSTNLDLSTTTSHHLKKIILNPLATL